MAKPSMLEWVFAEYPRTPGGSTPDERLRAVPIAISAVFAGLLAVFVVILVAASAITLLG